jgi:hypothetical protein
VGTGIYATVKSGPYAGLRGEVRGAERTATGIIYRLRVQRPGDLAPRTIGFAEHVLRLPGHMTEAGRKRIAAREARKAAQAQAPEAPRVTVAPQGNALAYAFTGTLNGEAVSEKVMRHTFATYTHAAVSTLRDGSEVLTFHKTPDAAAQGSKSDRRNVAGVRVITIAAA